MIEQVLAEFRSRREFADNITFWYSIPAKPAVYEPFPEGLNPKLGELLQAEGIAQLYTHQAQAFELVSAGHDIVVTPTASSKTLCYNLPVLNRILDIRKANPLFPLKRWLRISGEFELGRRLGETIKTYTYDGIQRPMLGRHSFCWQYRGH